MKVTISDFKKNDKQDVSIEFDEFDTYNLDKTLALIILPSLKEYKRQAGRRIDMRYNNFGKNLNIMIKAFELIIEDNCRIIQKENKLIEKGLKIFASKFRSLWW